MNPGDTVFVQGAAGAIVRMDVPGDVHRRERFDLDIKKGALRLIAPADIVEDPHPRWPDSVRYVLRDGAAPSSPPKVDPGPADEVTPEPDSDVTGPPKKSASKADWVEFAVAQGADREAAEAMTKDDLVDQFGG